MANGFDRLERFFGKRKASVASPDPMGAAATHEAAATEPQFPSPSFIRPKATRMAARQEVIVKQPSIRSPSVIEGFSPRRSVSVRGQNSTYSSDSYRLQYSPIRISSLRHLQEQRLFDGFDDFQFPRPPTYNGEISPVSSVSIPNSSFELSHQRNLEYCSLSQAQVEPDRLDTPPTSDPEDDELYCPRYFRNKRLPELPHGALPTPGPSPDLSPVLDYPLDQSQSIDILKRVAYQDLHRQLHESAGQPALRIQSQSSLALSTSQASLTKPTLREPDFNEFLTLSDEEVAERDLESPLMSGSEYSPAAGIMAPAIAPPRRGSLLTLTPPYASRPATAAAFEAARIANRYKFDLVYVVNLWPDLSVLPTAGPEEDTASFDSDFSVKSPRGLTGRLLAAYGLQNVKSPFQISAAVHAKILRADGWIEYRNQEAGNDEFARGYACAFYTGQHSRSNSLASGASSPARMRQSDRGIVFAAYRKPRADGNMVGIGCSKAELEEVHQDAEALVEMLIDIHSANRLRQPLSHSHHSDETGPMPSERYGLL